VPLVGWPGKRMADGDQVRQAEGTPVEDGAQGRRRAIRSAGAGGQPGHRFAAIIEAAEL
jgi:hypothetical protein